MAYATRAFGFDYRLTPVVKRLIIANVVVFFATFLVGRGFVYDWFGLASDRVLVRPWSPFTYMFVHHGFGHIAWNMLALFFFGPPLESRWGGREFFRFYVVAGLGTLPLLFVFGTAGVPVVGASGALFGVMLAFAMNWPDAPIYVFGIFPVKAKYLVGFFAFITLFNTLAGGSEGVADFAHLGGLLAGLAYLKLDWRAADKLERLKKKTTRRVRRLAIVPRDEEDEAAGSRRPEGWSQADERRLLDAVDRVLDKISEEGMSSLTPEERKILDEAARRRKTN